MRPLTRCMPLLLLAASSLTAGPIVVPPGLQPGDTYRIIFFTSQTHDAVSSDIDVYNNFVSEVAASVPELNALDTSWWVLGSTATVDALDNAGLNADDTTTSFYNTLGQLIATGVTTPYTGLFGGTVTSHSFQITDESGGRGSFTVYTGTRSDGQIRDPIGSSTPFVGSTSSTADPWISEGMVLENTNSFRFYAISGELTVPAAVPEPSSLMLVGVGTILIGAARFRKRRT